MWRMAPHNNQDMLLTKGANTFVCTALKILLSNVTCGEKFRNFLHDTLTLLQARLWIRKQSDVTRAAIGDPFEVWLRWRDSPERPWHSLPYWKDSDASTASSALKHFSQNVFTSGNITRVLSSVERRCGEGRGHYCVFIRLTKGFIGTRMRL